jgi:hypothetical protein
MSTRGTGASGRGSGLPFGHGLSNYLGGAQGFHGRSVHEMTQRYGCSPPSAYAQFVGHADENGTEETFWCHFFGMPKGYHWRVCSGPSVRA